MVNSTMQAEHFEATNEQYHASPGISNSKIGDYHVDPNLYYLKHEAKAIKEKPKDCYRRGNGVHYQCLLDNFDGKIVVIPDEVLSKGAKRGSDYKAWAEENADKIALKQGEYDEIQRYCDSVFANPDARFLVESTRANKRTEYNLRWTDEETGLLCRCRFDGFGLNCNFDIKTARANDAYHFAAHLWNYGYHRQDAFYSRGSRLYRGHSVPFLFLAVTEASCVIYELDDDFKEKGEQQIDEALRGIKQCQETGIWRKEMPRVTKLGMPNFVYTQESYEVSE